MLVYGDAWEWSGGSIFKRYHRPTLAADSAAAAWCEYHLKAYCCLKVHNATLNLNLNHRQFRDKLSKKSLIGSIIKLFTNQSEMSAIPAGNVIVKERNKVSY